MAWTGSTPTSLATGEFAAALAANIEHEELQRARAARVVAGHAADAAECAETLAMLGLGIPEPRAERI